MVNPTLPLFLRRALPPTLGALVFFLVAAIKPLLFFSCDAAHAFGKKPVVINPTPPSTPTEPPVVSGDVIRARWEPKASAGPEWSQHVFDALPALAPNLLSRAPNDVANFCPGYAKLSASDRKNFWVYLVSAVAQLESDFDPNSIYKENFNDANGNPVMSVGLLQLSLGDAPIYGCSFHSTADIEDPYKNLDCGLRILNKWVGSDHVISGHTSSGGWAGGARYWSTLRNAKLSQVEGWVRALPMCQ